MSFRQVRKSLWVDPEKRQGRVRMRLPLSLLGSIERNVGVPVELKDGQLTTPTPQVISQSVFDDAPADAISTLPLKEVLPRVEDLYYLRMRAISQAIVEGYWIDYSLPGVLQASVPLLKGQRICRDHRFWRVEDAIGAIVETQWDAQGAQSQNVPGINARFFVDSGVAPGTVRRLAWPVPGIHSCSVTVGFEWEPHDKHLALLEDDRFWWMLGEEVDGEIVRLLVTKILFYLEMSLVYEGADSYEGRLDDEEPEEAEMRRKKEMYSAKQQLPPASGTPNGEKTTVKLNAAQKTFLGLQHAGEDVPDAEVVQALNRLTEQSQAQKSTLDAAEAIISAERAEVVRLATLAEAGEDGKLPGATATMIEHTPAAKLAELKAHFDQKAQAKLGVKNGTARSSVEDNSITRQQEQAEKKQAATQAKRRSFFR
jgi:hypothetical protein